MYKFCPFREDTLGSNSSLLEVNPFQKEIDMQGSKQEVTKSCLLCIKGRKFTERITSLSMKCCYIRGAIVYSPAFPITLIMWHSEAYEHNVSVDIPELHILAQIPTARPLFSKFVKPSYLHKNYRAMIFRWCPGELCGRFICSFCMC